MAKFLIFKIFILDLRPFVNPAPGNILILILMPLKSDLVSGSCMNHPYIQPTHPPTHSSMYVLVQLVRGHKDKVGVQTFLKHCLKCNCILCCVEGVYQNQSINQL